MPINDWMEALKIPRLKRIVRKNNGEIGLFARNAFVTPR